MTLQEFVNTVKQGPVAFTETMAIIASNYDYTPSGFYNGLEDRRFYNQTGTNEGSCKLFAFAKSNGLDEQATLNCFGDYYTVDVLQHPNGEDHQNIRTFIECGWQGIEFDSVPLTLLSSASKATVKKNAG